MTIKHPTAREILEIAKVYNISADRGDLLTFVGVCLAYAGVNDIPAKQDDEPETWEQSYLDTATDQIDGF